MKRWINWRDETEEQKEAEKQLEPFIERVKTLLGEAREGRASDAPPDGYPGHRHPPMPTR
ncbi:Uncharacterised protein [Serratia fonticola]|uniref:Uncharacterized protein n=1 Tax=Serratia fonticola TaxID=47917 RepID=A0A4U9VC79_SERFO|nr:Uncharacterised protein [Serratia fonticola]